MDNHGELLFFRQDGDIQTSGGCDTLWRGEDGTTIVKPSSQFCLVGVFFHLLRDAPGLGGYLGAVFGCAHVSMPR